MYAIQMISCATGIPMKKDVLDKKFYLVTLAEKKY